MKSQFLVALAFVCGLSVSKLNAQQTAKVTPSSIGYLEYLPQDYNTNTNKYPIVIFLHGIGERGANTTDPEALKVSVQSVTNVGLAKYVKYGTNYPFIVVSPQLKSSYGTWPASYVMDVLNHVKTYLRVDEQRIYITGLSLGGFGTWTTLGAHPEVFAAAVPICSGGNAVNQACSIASQNVPLWAFHGTSDNVVSYGITTAMVNAVNACAPQPSPLAKTTLFQGLNHYIWDKVYLETDAINWMLAFRKGSPKEEPSPNVAPVANAGADRTTNASSITLMGSATDKDGYINAYKWTQYGGPSATLTNAHLQTATVSGLKDGKYYFRLTVTDNKGATDFDDMTITVSGQSVNAAPVANAGPDRKITSTSLTLNGSGTDKDGDIVSYRWTQYGGAAATLANAHTPNAAISGLKDGKYYFRLTVTDDDGATDFDNMLVVVSKSTSAGGGNLPPTANAGPDKRVGANVSSLALSGSATTQNGKIVSYQWTQYGGPHVTLANERTPTVTISGLGKGKYYFRLTVKDDRGGEDYDNVLVVVG